MRLTRCQAWLLRLMLGLVPMLAMPQSAQAIEVPGLGIRVCLCFPYVVCPCPDEPDLPAGSGPAPIPGSRERDRYAPGRTEPSAEEQQRRRQEEEQRERGRQQRERDARREQDDINRAWRDYRVDMDKAPAAHAIAQVVQHHRDVLRGQYAERAAFKAEFGQNHAWSPSTKSAALAEATQDVAQARVHQQTSGQSAHRSEDQYCQPVLGPSGRAFQTPPTSIDWQQLADATDQYTDAKLRLPQFSNYHDERQALLNVSAVLIEIADDHFATGETVLGTQNVTTLRHLLDTAVDFGIAFSPPVSMAWDAIQLATGSNLLTGEPLTKWDAGLLLTDLVAFGCTKAFTKTARALVKVAARQGDATRLAKPWLNYISKADEAARMLVPKDYRIGANTALGEQVDQVLEYLASESKPSISQKGRIHQREKSGGFAQAKIDFYKLAEDRQVTVKDTGLMVSSLADGTSINARPFSRSGAPTLEIQFSRSKVWKIRYHD
jgi:hypothetical protein